MVSGLAMHGKPVALSRGATTLGDTSILHHAFISIFIALWAYRTADKNPMGMSLWHPGSEQPVYLALPAQRPCLLATHNILVQKTTALLMLADRSLYYNRCRGQAARTRCGWTICTLFSEHKGASIITTTRQRNNVVTELHSTGTLMWTRSRLEQRSFPTRLSWNLAWHARSVHWMYLQAHNRHRHNEKQYHDI